MRERRRLSELGAWAPSFPRFDCLPYDDCGCTEKAWKRDPGSVSEIYLEPASFVEFTSSRQDRYEADPNIYRSFPDWAMEVKALCDKNRHTE